MSGKMCNGDATISGVKSRNSAAYCEGAYARTLATDPTNPHEAGSESATAWDAGVADTLAGEGRECCAAMGPAAT